MGSLLSSPKTPKATPQGASASPAASTPAITQAAQSSQKTREAASEEREQNLLSRNRGRLGTIETSFRGFLSASNTTNGRKNLLGE